MSAACASAIATEASYVPWTIDDFNSNCELVEQAKVSATKPVAMATEIPGDEDVGE